ncbi:MAG: 5-oxoprolinase subunit PxpB [Zoogloeaceae bacterium]|nr:5-oxoprolinase subunit PxpB [Zoogloeaceae bacterium]
MNYRLLDVGDTAVTVEFGQRIDPALLATVAACDQAVLAAQAAGRLPGLVETVPTFRSLTLIYDPLQTSRAAIDPVLHALFSAPLSLPDKAMRLWCLPVCYGGELGPDLEAMASALGLSPAEVVERHAAETYRVYMLGFLPGFPFMGDLPPALSLPRRHEPRLRVPAGSVATAGQLTAIYPWESPGGWHLLGRCPVPLFSARWPDAALFRPGDQVRFHAVDTGEYAELEDRWRTDSQLPTEYLLQESPH